MKTYRLASVLALGILSVTTAYAQVTLTDLTLWGSSSTGGYSPTYPDIWETRPAGNWNMWIQSSGSFLNGPSDTAARPNITLADGVYTFRLAGAGGVDYTRLGINLFFNGSTTPSISAFGPMLTAAGAHTFYANSSAVTGGVLGSYGSSVPGAGTLSFVIGDKQVTLTDFYFASKALYNLDLVSTTTTATDGIIDNIGGITLSVQTIPEPSFSILALVALGAVAARRRLQA